MHSLPGGEALLKKKLTSSLGSGVPTIAYQVPDETRDRAAAELLANNQIEIPMVTGTHFCLSFIPCPGV